ncbi:hypothetical protein EB061_03695 [bacterium]|nr:hypothetical protein [bacterium]
MTYPIKTLKQIPISIDNEAEEIDFLLDYFDQVHEPAHKPLAEPGSIVVVNSRNGGDAVFAVVEINGRSAASIDRDYPGETDTHWLKEGQFEVVRGPRQRRAG